MNERIEVNKDEKKKKRKFLPEIQALYIIPMISRNKREIRKEILKIKLQSDKTTTQFRKNKTKLSESITSRQILNLGRYS